MKYGLFTRDLFLIKRTFYTLFGKIGKSQELCSSQWKEVSENERGRQRSRNCINNETSNTQCVCEETRSRGLEHVWRSEAIIII